MTGMVEYQINTVRLRTGKQVGFFSHSVYEYRRTELWLRLSLCRWRLAAMAAKMVRQRALSARQVLRRRGNVTSRPDPPHKRPTVGVRLPSSVGSMFYLISTVWRDGALAGSLVLLGHRANAGTN